MSRAGIVEQAFSLQRSSKGILIHDMIQMTRSMRHLGILLFTLFSTTFAQVADKANSAYKTPEGRDGVAQSLSAAGRDAGSNVSIVNQQPPNLQSIINFRSTDHQSACR